MNFRIYKAVIALPLLNRAFGMNIEAPKGGVAGALVPIILKAWSPGAQTIPMAILSNFKKKIPWSPEEHAMEPWSAAILPLGARSPLKYALETWSPRSLRGLQYIEYCCSDPGSFEEQL